MFKLLIAEVIIEILIGIVAEFPTWCALKIVVEFWGLWSAKSQAGSKPLSLSVTVAG